ncbi:Hypothetical protein R9X50_00535600 [Acrodontium crateriforme]|uniref:Uncharacterized protein n=1 Tax=Acrodontium crateriforme TaxID=150365 RepID=A0AAQ3RAT2_9PEZI|nr:Hypothetical protein R9X50_00535600 [Acrodontium crateriforme]
MGSEGKKAKGRMREKRRKAAKEAARAFRSGAAKIPTITEDDLLAFRISHFGDATKPINWFVDAETAINFVLDEQEEEEDDLGHYEDGVKRTLTDEQIAIFRHSEEQELVRLERLENDEFDYQNRHVTITPEGEHIRSRSPALSASSVEDELLGIVSQKQTKRLPSKSKPRRQRSPSLRSDASRSTTSSNRRRRQEIPYDQRHKRRWEQYIEGEDPTEGSVTHRRLAREMDDQLEEVVDMDY